jgi:hypothetical protein
LLEPAEHQGQYHFILQKYGVDSLTILNRDVGKAQSLASDVSRSRFKWVNVNADSISEINAYLKEDGYTWLTTTPLGMDPILTMNL